MPKQLAILLHNSEFWHSLAQLLNNNSVSAACKVPAMQFCLDVQTECFPYFLKAWTWPVSTRSPRCWCKWWMQKGFIFKQIPHWCNFLIPAILFLKQGTLSYWYVLMVLKFIPKRVHQLWCRLSSVFEMAMQQLVLWTRALFITRDKQSQRKSNKHWYSAFGFWAVDVQPLSIRDIYVQIVNSSRQPTSFSIIITFSRLSKHFPDS